MGSLKHTSSSSWTLVSIYNNNNSTDMTTSVNEMSCSTKALLCSLTIPILVLILYPRQNLVRMQAHAIRQKGRYSPKVYHSACICQADASRWRGRTPQPAGLPLPEERSPRVHGWQWTGSPSSRYIFPRPLAYCHKSFQ